ncbi:MAG: hypothetical protein ACXAEU_03385 [Candidatus Hodarchaeales archaeon]
MKNLANRGWALEEEATGMYFFPEYLVDEKLVNATSVQGNVLVSMNEQRENKVLNKREKPNLINGNSEKQVTTLQKDRQENTDQSLAESGGQFLEQDAGIQHSSLACFIEHLLGKASTDHLRLVGKTLDYMKYVIESIKELDDDLGDRLLLEIVDKNNKTKVKGNYELWWAEYSGLITRSRGIRDTEREIVKKTIESILDYVGSDARRPRRFFNTLAKRITYSDKGEVVVGLNYKYTEESLREKHGLQLSQPVDVRYRMLDGESNFLIYTTCAIHQLDINKARNELDQVKGIVLEGIESFMKERQEKTRESRNAWFGYRDKFGDYYLMNLERVNGSTNPGRIITDFLKQLKYMEFQPQCIDRSVLQTIIKRLELEYQGLEIATWQYRNEKWLTVATHSIDQKRTSDVVKKHLVSISTEGTVIDRIERVSKLIENLEVYVPARKSYLRYQSQHSVRNLIPGKQSNSVLQLFDFNTIKSDPKRFLRKFGYLKGKKLVLQYCLMHFGKKLRAVTANMQNYMYKHEVRYNASGNKENNDLNGKEFTRYDIAEVMETYALYLDELFSDAYRSELGEKSAFITSGYNSTLVKLHEKYKIALKTENLKQMEVTISYFDGNTVTFDLITSAKSPKGLVVDIWYRMVNMLNHYRDHSDTYKTSSSLEIPLLQHEKLVPENLEDIDLHTLRTRLTSLTAAYVDSLHLREEDLTSGILYLLDLTPDFSRKNIITEMKVYIDSLITGSIDAIFYEKEMSENNNNGVIRVLSEIIESKKIFPGIGPSSLREDFAFIGNVEDTLKDLGRVILAQFINTKGYFFGIAVDIVHEKLFIDVLALEFGKTVDNIDNSKLNEVEEVISSLEPSSRLIEKSKLDEKLSNAISWLSSDKRTTVIMKKLKEINSVINS